MTRLLALASILVGSTSLAQSAPPLSVTYKPAADKLIAASLADPEGYANLQYLCDHIGKRISGSESLLTAIAWATDLMKKEGFANVRTQAATVPHWVRGEESGEIVAPVTKKLHMLGLGMSVGTPPGGITAEVVVVADFAALTKLGKAGIAGRIVVYVLDAQGAAAAGRPPSTLAKVDYAGAPVSRLRLLLPALAAGGLYQIQFVGQPGNSPAASFAAVDFPQAARSRPVDRS